MPKKITLPNGAVEYIPTNEELLSQNKFKGKKPADLTIPELKELIYMVAKHLNLLE